MKLGYTSYIGTNSNGDTVFELYDDHKGDAVRAFLYFSESVEETSSETTTNYSIIIGLAIRVLQCGGQ